MLNLNNNEIREYKILAKLLLYSSIIRTNFRLIQVHYTMITIIYKKCGYSFTIIKNHVDNIAPILLRNEIFEI